MASLPESSTFDAGVYQLELTDPVIGGPSGVSNTPLKNLANRTKYLKDHVDALESSRAPLASPAFTGAPTAPTQASSDNSTKVATTAFVKTAVAAVDLSGLAPKDSPALTGTPTAPTAPVGDSSTKLATTAFVNAEIANDIAGIAPAGAVQYFARATAPAGWLKANGAAVSRATYAALFAVIGTTFGSGDGSTTFNLPDLRGEFIRGLDDGRGADAGRSLGTAQGDAIRNITGFVDIANDGGAHHAQSKNWGGAFTQPPNRTMYDATTNNRYTTGPFGVQFDASAVVPTASENRPRNMAMLACIKF